MAARIHGNHERGSAAVASAAIVAKPMAHARQVWSLAKAEAGKAKKNGNTEWIAAAEKAFAIAKRAVQAAATAAETATAASTYSLEEVEAIVAAAAAEAAAAATATAEREVAKAAAVAADNQRKTAAKNAAAKKRRKEREKAGAERGAAKGIGTQIEHTMEPLHSSSSAPVLGAAARAAPTPATRRNHQPPPPPHQNRNQNKMQAAATALKAQQIMTASGMCRVSSSSSSSSALNSSSSTGSSHHFPFRLHDMLDGAERHQHTSIVSWCPDGRAFRIHQPELMLPVLKQYFRQTKYKSLLRQLQAYNFQRTTKGERNGTVSHPHFQRGRRSLCLAMKRKPNGATAAAQHALVAQQQQAMLTPALTLASAGETNAEREEREEGEKAEKITSAIASEYRKIQAVLERVEVEKQKRPLAASTITNNKRQKKERDRIRDITPPSWLEEDPVMHELHQQIQAEASEREQRVAKTKNETNRYEKIVAMKMKKWLVSGAVRDVAPIKKKRKDLEEQARIQRIDDQADSLLLDYGYKMDKFVLETMQTMQPYLEAAAIINNSDPPGTVATSPPLSILQLTLCGIYHGVCKELKVIQEANVAPQLGKCLHDIIPRDSRTIADKNKGVFFRKIIKVCNCYLDFLIMIGEALTSDLGTRGNNKIMKVLAYQVNREKEDMMMKVLDLICTEAHAVQSLFCNVNGALQKKLLIEIVPRFIDCKSLFLKDGKSLSTLSQEEYNSEVVAHGTKWARIRRSIQDHLVKDTPLPQYITDLNLNIENATMQHVHYREKDGSYTKSRQKVLVFGIPWCIIVFCTGASGNSFCRNGDLVLHKFKGTIFVDGLGHVFERGPFDVNDELREVPQQVSEDGYYFVPVHFSSQFIPYIYQSTMRVATLQWAGILGSWYLLDETMDHLTGEKDKNGILHTQPASKQENIDRRPLQGLPPLVDGRKCIY